jgi:hypothetical protein
MEHVADPSIPSFEEWVRGAVQRHMEDAPEGVDLDTLLMCTKPTQSALRYTKMKAFGNHFRIEDDTSSRLQTYDSSVASLFEVSTEDGRGMSLNYIGVLKDILKLDYGPLKTPVILLRCEWMKREDNQGNPTYIKDDAGFLVVNFRHKLPRMSDPFIFPNQATQVFFSEDRSRPGWKVVLRKEPRARGHILDTTDVFITTSNETRALSAPTEVPASPPDPCLVGAIELSVADHLLASANY